MIELYCYFLICFCTYMILERVSRNNFIISRVIFSGGIVGFVFYCYAFYCYKDLLGLSIFICIFIFLSSLVRLRKSDLI